MFIHQSVLQQHENQQYVHELNHDHDLDHEADHNHDPESDHNQNIDLDHDLDHDFDPLYELTFWYFFIVWFSNKLNSMSLTRTLAQNLT